MKPVHAGLLGSDSLILLDEAHLSEPFRQTLKAVARYQTCWGDREGASRAPFSWALLTATPGQLTDETFGLIREDREHPVLRRRLEAAKLTKLLPMGGNKDRASEDKEDERIAEVVKSVDAALAHLAKEQLKARPVVGVVVNRVLRARRVFRRLQKTYGPGEDGGSPRADVFLVIGPAREVDREMLASQLDPIKTGREDERLSLRRPRIIVATQTIEVGADLDFDALITEIAALDALKQRFGRLNREGRPFMAYAAILAHQEDVRPGKEGDPVYGQAASATWHALRGLTERPDSGGKVNFGVSPIAAVPWIGELSAEAQHPLLTPKADAPVLMPAYADLWSQTSPVPAADPEVALFLHGPDRSPASIQIVWRADLELNRGDFDATALLAAMPPKPGEAVEVSLAAACRWLQSAGAAEFADAPARDPEETEAGHSRPAYRWAGPGTPFTQKVYARELRPNDLIVVPADYGGCDEFGWDPASEAKAGDVADKAASPFVALRYALRLTPGLIEGAAPKGDDESAVARRGQAAQFAADFIQVMADLRDRPRRDDARALIEALRAAKPPLAIDAALEELETRTRGRPQAIFPYGEDEEGCQRGVVLLAQKGIKLAIPKPDAELAGGAPSTEDDWLGSASGEAQTLDEHSRDAGDQAAAFAKKVGLGAEIAGDVALAAYLHDTGKADPRFQRMLYGGDWFAVDDRKILAKSLPGISPAVARAKAGLPQHWRHEALSVRIAREDAHFHEAHDPELVLWLIGVHHGYGRPLFPHLDPWDERDRNDLPNVNGAATTLKRGAGPQSLAFCFNGSDWPQIFEHLKCRYGIWELARLEAIVRLADHRASEHAGHPQADGGSS